MKKNLMTIFSLLLILITSMLVKAQNLAPNPFIRSIYTADPSAHVWADGRLYVYPSHDIAPARGADLMDKYHVFSTTDMVNWVDHGQILQASDVPWGRAEGGFMWAPDCAYKNGTYYFYFPHPSGTDWGSTWKIGIATSTSPASGFTVQGYIPGLESLIDPCVFVDDDGQAYFYYGGGGVCKGGKLKSNMMEIDGTMQNMQGLVDFHEATWVHKRNGIYYLSYADNHDTADGKNQMQYATSTNPLGPWTPGGVYIDHTDSYTDHGSIVEYKGQWYAFYHNSALSGDDWLRSICVDKLFYNADGSIQKVIQTKGHGTPYGGTPWAIPGLIEAENYDVGGQATSYRDSDPANNGGQYRTSEGVDVENCGEGGYDVGYINNGEWLEYTVNVAATGTYTLNLRVATESTPSAIGVEFDGVDKTGVMTVPATGNWQTYTTISKSVSLNAGQHIMTVRMKGGSFNFNNISFTSTGAAPVVSSSNAASGTVNTSFTYNITASNNPTSYGASSLPPGLSVNTSTGVISGTPTTAGTFNTTITATNASGTGSATVTITINNPSSQAIPGTIQAENYCAMSGIQLEATSDTGAGQDVGWIDGGDWLDYCVNVSTTGTYSVSARVASPNTGGQFQLKIGSNVLTTMNVPNTGGWQTWTNVTSTLNLTAGTQTIRLQVITGGFNINWLQFALSNSQSAYPNGTPWPIPGTIEVENYDNGGEGVAYHDNEAANQGGQYRTIEGVDVEVCSEGGYNIGWTNTGEWLEYTVNVATTGNYNIDVREASTLAGGTFHIEFNGVDKTGLFTTNNTGAWQTWTTLSKTGISLNAGVQVMRIYLDNANFNLNKVTFTSASGNVAVTGVSVSPTTATINAGSTQQLTATVSPSNATNQSVTWSSSNTGVATVSSSGLVTGVAAGSATITVTTVDGGKTATSAITVNVSAGTISCKKTSVAITVNGTLSETSWTGVVNNSIAKATTGTPNNTATFGVLWDNTNLYIGAKILDANLFSDSPNQWDDDAVEIYIDANNNKSTTYDGLDNQIIKNYNQGGVFTKLSISGLQHAWASISGGYSVEIAVPWSALGISAPAQGTTIGFDIGYDDDDNGGTRDGQAVWNGDVNNYQNTSKFGSVVLSNTTAREATAEIISQTKNVFCWPTLVERELHVETDGSYHTIEVIDLMGRSSYFDNTIKDKYSFTVDLGHLLSGLYFVKLHAQAESKSIRIIKK